MQKFFGAILLVGTVAGTGCRHINSKPESEVKITSGETARDSLDPGAPLMLKSTVNIRGPRGNCTGTLISQSLILTAAHCITDSRGSYFIRFGESDNETPIRSSDILVHPDYQTNGADPGADNDLALIRLNTPAPSSMKPVKILDSSSSITPIKFNSFQILSRGQRLYIAGFGRVTRQGRGTSSLLFANVETYASNVSENTIFMSSESRAGCPGDSGGPAYAYQNGQLILVGVMAMASCDTNEYFITSATDLSRYSNNWLRDATGPNEFSTISLPFTPSQSPRSGEIAMAILYKYGRPEGETDVDRPTTPSHHSPTTDGPAGDTLNCKDGNVGMTINLRSRDADISIIGGSFAGDYPNSEMESTNLGWTISLNSKLTLFMKADRTSGRLSYRTDFGVIAAGRFTCS